MPEALAPADIAKRAAAARALELVEDGMVLGLGTGSTAVWFVRLLGDRVADGLRVAGVATSSATAALAEEHGVPLRSLGEAGRIDLTVDGADEIDPALNLIKGGGAALLQEKIVAAASAHMVVIADASKQVGALGRFPLPVEVVRFGWQATLAAVERALQDQDVARREVRIRDGATGPLLTDEGHHILDLQLDRIGEPAALARRLSALPGVVEHGLFLDMAEAAVIGREDGGTELLRRAPLDVVELMRNEDA